MKKTKPELALKMVTTARERGLRLSWEVNPKPHESEFGFATAHTKHDQGDQAVGIDKRLIKAFASAFAAGKIHSKVSELETAGEVPRGYLAGIIKDARTEDQGISLSRYSRGAEAISDPEILFRNMSRPDLVATMADIMKVLNPSGRLPKDIERLRTKLRKTGEQSTDPNFLDEVVRISANRYSDPKGTLISLRSAVTDSSCGRLELCHALTYLAVLHKFNGDLLRSTYLFQFALSGIYQDPSLWARIALSCGHFLIDVGKLKTAYEVSAVAASDFMVAGDIRSFATCVLNQATALFHCGQYRRCLDLCEAVKDLAGGHLKLTRHQLVAWSYIRSGKAKQALPFVQILVNKSNDGGSVYGGHAEYLEGYCLLKSGSPAEGRMRLEAAADTLRSINRFDYCLAALALIEARIKTDDPRGANDLIFEVRLTISALGENVEMLRLALTNLDRLQLDAAARCIERARISTRLTRRAKGI